MIECLLFAVAYSALWSPLIFLCDKQEKENGGRSTRSHLNYETNLDEGLQAVLDH